MSLLYVRRSLISIFSLFKEICVVLAVLITQAVGGQFKYIYQSEDFAAIVFIQDEE